jgi:tetratricopeptide (TPR) repeat protein
MGEFEFEGPSHSEIWEKIGSSSWSEKLEGLIEAASEKANVSGDSLGALPYLDEARAVAEDNGDLTALAHVYMLLGMTYSRLNDWSACALAHEAGADASKRGLAAELEVDHLAFAGRAYRRLRDYGSMRRNFELALKLAGECGYAYRTSLKAEYGRYLRKIGDLEAALGLLSSAYSDGVPGPAARAAGELVRLKLDSGDVAGAMTYAEEAFAAASYMEDMRSLNSAQFMLAKAKLASGDVVGARLDLDALKERQKWAKIKHKVRVDALFAEVLMRLGEWDSALPVWAKVIPMLRKEELWNDLGAALQLRAECHAVMSNMDEYFNTMLEASSAFGAAENWQGQGSVMLEIANQSLAEGNLVAASDYALRVVDQVLLSFSDVHNVALGIYAVALVRQGKTADAELVVSRLDAVKDLAGIALAHKLQASALLATGVKAKNLAAKAVREYLLLNRHSYASMLAPLM